MAVEMERPGVQVFQKFKSLTPTILKPQMPACVVGACRQVVEAVTDTGALDPNSIETVPARLVASWVTIDAGYTSSGAETLYVSVNGAAEETVVFPGTNPTATEIVAAIELAAIPGLIAEVEVSGTQERVVLRTTGRDSNASIRVGTSTGAFILSTFGIYAGYTYHGASGYSNETKLSIAFADYPDPRSNLADLTVDYDTVRVFVNPGSGTAAEVLKTEALLRGATSAVSVQDDGDGDNLSPYLNFASAVFAPTSAVLTGSGAIVFGSLGTGTLILKIDGGSPVTTTFATPVSAAAARDAINAAHGSTVASLSGSTLVITSPTTGASSSVERTGGSVSSANIGFAVGAYAGATPSSARAQGTTDLTALTYSTQVQSRSLVISLNGGEFQTVTMSASASTSAHILAAFTALLGTGTAIANDASNLVLKALSTYGGVESSIRINKDLSDATLLTALGLTTSGAPFETVSVVHGGAMAPIVGDEVWIDGVRAGTVTALVPTATNRLRLSAEKLLSFTGSTWYIVAKGLDNAAASATRPSSNLIIDTNSGSLTIKAELFHDSAGTPSTAAGTLATYLAYTALRKDVSPAKASGNFGLLRIGSLTDLATQLAPIDTQNPLGLGMYMAMLNCPGAEVTGCGVDEAPATAPDGSTEAYGRAFEFLESKDVYGIAPMTHDAVVGQLAKIHVDTMSEPANKLERVVFLNPLRPTRVSSTLVASAPTGNVSGAPSSVVMTGIANLQALLAAAGLPGPSYTPANNVYLEFEDDTNKYLVSSVSSGNVTIAAGPITTGNSDGFYFDNNGTAVFAAAVVDRPFSIQIRGALLSSKTDEAVAYADLARGYLDRRVRVVAPDTAICTIGSLDTEVEGYYLCAALVGRISVKAPSQPLTEDALVGFKGVVGSQDLYSEPQLRIMCGGGLWVMYQEADGQPIRTRHQLTSDVSALQVQEASVTDALDFGAKTLRTSFRNFAGRYNITTSLQDALSLVADGVRDYLLRNNVFQSIDIVAIQQDESELDAMNVIYDVVTLKPANKIRITMRAS